MEKVYTKTIRYKCLAPIYLQGKSFVESGNFLIESEKSNLFVPGMLNICLGAEILLKSIHASVTFKEYELEKRNDCQLLQGCEETIKILPSGTGHVLSKLFDQLPSDYKTEITELATHEGYKGCVLKGLKIYDKVFVEQRYMYEKNFSQNLSTHPLLQIVNAINKYCEKIHIAYRKLLLILKF